MVMLYNLLVFFILVFYYNPAEAECQNPTEIYPKLYLKCWPRDGPNFPSINAICKCKRCPLQVKLTCYTSANNTARWQLEKNQDFCAQCKNVSTECENPMTDFPDVYDECITKEAPQLSKSYASCTCKRCNVEEKLTCFETLSHSDDDYNYYDFIWKLNTQQKSCEQCMICPSLEHDADINCENKEGGYLGEIRDCNCKYNCLRKRIQCNANRTWSFVDENHACDEKTYIAYESNGKLDVQFNDGNIQLSCAPGYVNISQGDVHCIEGEMIGHFTQCEREQKTTTTTTTTTIRPRTFPPTTKTSIIKQVLLQPTSEIYFTPNNDHEKLSKNIRKTNEEKSSPIPLSLLTYILISIMSLLILIIIIVICVYFYKKYKVNKQTQEAYYFRRKNIQNTHLN